MKIPLNWQESSNEYRCGNGIFVVTACYPTRETFISRGNPNVFFNVQMLHTRGGHGSVAEVQNVAPSDGVYRRFSSVPSCSRRRSGTDTRKFACQRRRASYLMKARLFPDKDVPNVTVKLCLSTVSTRLDIIDIEKFVLSSSQPVVSLSFSPPTTQHKRSKT
jgi:hypothetical protein